MTAQEAKKKGLYEKSIWKLDFQDIDTNNDGVIDDKEMLKYRDDEANGSFAIGIFHTILSFGMVGPDDIQKGYKMTKENDQYRKQHNIK